MKEDTDNRIKFFFFLIHLFGSGQYVSATEHVTHVHGHVTHLGSWLAGSQLVRRLADILADLSEDGPLDRPLRRSQLAPLRGQDTLRRLILLVHKNTL